MFPVVLSCLVAFIAIFLFYKLNNNKYSQFSGQGLRVAYWPKWLLHLIAISIWQMKRPKRVNNYDMNSELYNSCGIVPTAEDVNLESPKTLITDRHEDGVFIWGGDAEGRTIVAKLVRLSRRRASAFLMVKDKQGNLYTLPNQPDSNVINVGNEHSWRGNGLLLECVEPMRTWRLKFNGLLRKGYREHYITDDVDDDDDNDGNAPGANCSDARIQEHSKVFHARIDFLWKAMRCPVDIWRDSSSRLLAHALAREYITDLPSFKALQRDGYDQWGALHGTIKLDDDISQTWYLRGARQHRWGMSDSATNLHMSFNLFSYFGNGDILWLEAFSYRSEISHCLMGYVYTAAGCLHSISSTSLNLSKIAENNENLTSVFVECKAGGKNFNLWNRLLEAISFHTGDPWTLKHDVRPTFSASSLHGEGWGLAFMSNRCTGLCPVPEREHLKLPNPVDLVEPKLVVSFLGKGSLTASLTGGKGASLACLKYIENKTDDHFVKFVVPNGVIVTSHAWQKQIEASSELRGAITSLEKAVTSSIVSGIKEACQRVIQVIESLDVCSEILHCLEEIIQTTISDSPYEKRFAVRSSACGEDASEASSAGQNETVLGCYWKENDFKSPSSIFRALVTCWGSQFSYQSVEYRRQRGQPVNDGMAVVIQEMAPAYTAGVMFTRDPVTGSPASITITANYGLGESVVSAATEPDTIIVKRTWRNKLSLQKKSIGEKKIKHILKERGGTDEVEVKESDRNVICLSDHNALRLAKIGILVESYYGSPRDIEFALSENTIYLLQARPLTVLDEWTDYELMHESDASFISDNEMSTLANVAEVFNGYICPLTTSAVVRMLDLAIQRNLSMREWPMYEVDPYCQRIVLSCQGKCIINVGEMCYRGNDDHVSMVNKVVDLAIFGRLVTTQKIHKWAVSRFGVMSPWAKFIRTGIMFCDMLLNSRRVKRNKLIFSSYDIVTSRVTSASDLFRQICMKIPDLSKICNCHCHTSAVSTMTQCIAFVVLAENKGEISPSVVQDMTRLLACVSSTESAEVPTSLKALAQTIADHEEAEEFMLMSPDEGKVWLESHPEEVGGAFRAFLQKHGHRCIKEFDLRTLSWGLAPESLVYTLQMMVKNPQSYRRSKENADLESVLNNLKSPIPGSKKRILKVVLKLCSDSVAFREETKSLVIRTVDAFRKAYRVLGQVMASECRLPDADLIFFLQHREIEVLLETRSVRIVSKAIRRRKLMSQMEALSFPEIMFGVPQPINLNSLAGTTEMAEGEGDVVRGTPVCFGSASGPARVIKRLQDASQIQSGDILITFCTDIGWTPYFPLLGGVITEIGGLISHGAVVAREYGLPCVVGVKGATDIFVSGETVLIDGEEGFIRRVSEKSK